ncbi:transmembrane protein 51 [Ambystoma mexicanum]|uniref:transmembrane protein 51 n=1 Tax=Ambystoma mexicanum TaxID=8296 RepID=UPI0037E7929D
MATSRSSGSHYALSAIGIGMLVLGIIMAVWNLAPGFGNNDNPPASHGNSSKPEQNDGVTTKSKTFSVAYVLVGSGIVLLLLAICLSVREKKKRQSGEVSTNLREVAALPQEDNQEDEAIPQYGIPSYEEVMGTEFSAADPTPFDRNERISMSLPSYESLNEIDETTPTRTPPSPKEGSSNDLQRSKRNSRSGKGVKPLKVRRIKSEKLHLKDFRLNLSNKDVLAQKIEPLTPPPQYDGKTIESTQPI